MVNKLAKQYLVSDHFSFKEKINEPIKLKYKEVKDLILFKASMVSYYFCNCSPYEYYHNQDKYIANLSIPDKCWKCKDRIDITLERALKLLKDRPTLFNRPEILCHLYRYVKLYDPEIYNKIEKRVKKNGNSKNIRLETDRR